jgi:hypothetical protein
MNNHSRRLAALEGQLAQHEHQAELEDLKQLAHDARAKIEAALAIYRRGEPIPEPAIRHESPAHRALQLRLDTLRSRLLQFGDIRNCTP